MDKSEKAKAKRTLKERQMAAYLSLCGGNPLGFGSFKPIPALSGDSPVTFDIKLATATDDNDGTSDEELIARIAERITALPLPSGVPGRFEVMDTLTALHGTHSLNLRALLKSRDDDLRHDVLGILRFFNHVTGDLNVTVLQPRCCF